MNLLLIVNTADHRIEWASGEFNNRVDLPTSDIVGRPLDDILAVTSHPSWTEALLALDTMSTAIQGISWRVGRGAATFEELELCGVQSIDGGLSMLISLATITPSVCRVGASFREPNSTALVRSATTGVVVHDGRHILSSNQVAAQMVGLDVADLVGTPTASFISPDDIAHLVKVRIALTEQPDMAQSLRLHLHGPGATTVPVNASITLVQWEGTDAVQVVMEQVVRRPTTLSSGATSNPTRERLTNAREQTAAMVLIGVDQMRIIDAELDPAAADMVMIRLVRRVSASLRATDSVTRVGTTRFLAHIGIESGTEALSIAQRIQRVIAEPIDLDGSAVTVVASFGAARGSWWDDAQLRNEAEQALVRAREAGGGHLFWYEPTVEPHAWDDDGSFVDEVRAAMASGEIYVAFQPIVELRDGQLRKLEALTRWDHLEHGAIPPSEFIPLAEQTGVINELGDWVLSQACHDVVRMEAEGITVDISVNVSVVQLREDLPTRVAAILASSGLAATRLGIEVTESVLVDDKALASLHDLHTMGVHLIIDDFGTGHANLQNLSRLPVDALKVDTMFVSGLGVEPRDTAIVRSVVNLARELGLVVVAEGVETESQRVQLLALQCRLGQGWLFSRALRYDDLIAAYGAIAAATVPLTAPLTADLAGNVAESLRLAALKASRILDTDPEPAFDALVSLASQLMVAPIALVSLIDADRQWFKARVGIDVTETTRDLSFCAVALTQPDRPLIVTDASTDPRFSSNPMVTSAYHIRAYAGVLIHSREGLALGTLCVIDTEPRSFSDEQVAQLELLAEQAAELIDLRRRAAELDDLYCRAGRLSGASHVSTGLPQVSTLASIDYERLHAVVDGWRGHVTEGQATGARARGGGARREATNAQVMERDPEAVAMWLAATRALLRVETSAEAITVCSQLIDDVGGWTIPARLDDGRAVPIDCSFGHGEPLFPMAASTLARTRLRLILPDLLDDARRAIERIHERDDLIEQTRTDSLTGLMNRRAVDHVLVSLQPNDALVVIDLDDFKSVNDRWGHAVGDEVLIAVTAVLREQGRAGDVFARLGGDELLAVLFDVGEHGLQSFMKDLHHAWHRLRPYDVTYTAGAAWVRDRTGPQALAAADAALYSAKAGGRDKVVVEQSTVANQRAC